MLSAMIGSTTSAGALTHPIVAIPSVSVCASVKQVT